MLCSDNSETCGRCELMHYFNESCKKNLIKSVTLVKMVDSIAHNIAKFLLYSDTYSTPYSNAGLPNAKDYYSACLNIKLLAFNT